MSAVRRTDARAHTRKVVSSPYARPQNSGWSWRKLLDPIRKRVFGDSEEDEDLLPRRQQVCTSQSSMLPTLTTTTLPGQFFKTPSPEPLSNEDTRYTQSHETIDSHASEPPLSRSTTVSPKRPAPSAGPNASATLDNVIDFLTDAVHTTLRPEEIQRLTDLVRSAIPDDRTICQELALTAGKSIRAIQVEGIISTIKKSPIYRKVEPFRFQSAPSSRAASPAVSTPQNAPKKTLKRNPNGSLRWNGGGSSKQRTRGNRYGSPAFGTPHITPEKPSTTGDGKRRRVEDKPSESPSDVVPKLTAPPPKTNGVVSHKPTPSRLRTPTISKHTAPAQPSPLRQTWSGASPSSSQEDLSAPSPPKAPSVTASFMSELVSKVTPPPKPDVSNPYQTASPLAKIIPLGPVRRSTRRAKATTKPEAAATAEKADTGKQSEEKGKTVPSQSFVEATLPKGSKRSRPPNRSEKSPSPEPIRSNTWKAPITTSEDIDELEDDEDESERIGKKAKGFAAPAPAPIFTATAPAEKSKDVTMTNGTSSKPSPVSVFGNPAPAPVSNGLPSFSSLKPTTAPSRPSKLRYSYQPEGTSAPSSPSADDKSADSEMSAPPPPTFKASFSNLPTAPASSSSSIPNFFSKPAEVKPPVVAEKLDPKTQALNVPSSELPTYTFTITIKANPGYSKERNIAKLKSTNSLPTFDFPRPSRSKPEVKGFDWAAATGKARPASSSSTWTCNVCQLQSPESFKEKCSVCEAPRPSAAPKATPAPAASAPAPAPAPKAFDWSAAGIKPPTTSGWKCSGCFLDRPDSEKDKCGLCEAPRPGASAAAAAAPTPAAARSPFASSGFDWAAAGIKPPAASGWKCSGCFLDRPDSEKDKCGLCDAARPGAAPKPVATFDWSAAGMKAPTASGSQWKCGTCALMNPLSATKCTICEAPKP